MEDIEIINLWKKQNEKIDKSLYINKKLLADAINRKAQKALVSFRRLTTTGIISFVIYLFVLIFLLYYAVLHYSSAANYFIVSISAIILINIKGFTDYIRHLFLINNIDFDGNITQIQQRLNKLQLSVISHARIMVLQCPFWTTIYLSDAWFPQTVGLAYIIFQIAFTLSFTYLAYWLYKNHKIGNLDKKWFRVMISGSGGASIKRAMDFYTEIEIFMDGENDF
ncbi:MAG: hypothetical protein LBT27_03085 [Prevotellaceae bacterium]|jgi:hypothetical protein|nr:hypothetical protein [Prevotellaceae bacterium]